jgi:hypothetical protein
MERAQVFQKWFFHQGFDRWDVGTGMSHGEVFSLNKGPHLWEKRKTSMIARLWRTQVDLTRLVEYEQFAETRSLPMFRQQRGFLGVFFLREHHNCLVLSL